MDYRQKDPSCFRYSTFPGRRHSHVLQHDPTYSYLLDSSDPNTWLTQHSRAARDIHHTTQQNQIPLPTTYPSQRKLSRRELAEYISEVRNLVLREKQRSDKVRHQEREMREAWKNTWPKHWRRTREDFSQQDLQANPQYCPQGSAFGDWRSASGIEKVLGYGHERFQPKIDREREQNPCILRNMESTLTAHSFRQPPSYMAPPAYSSPKDRGSKSIAPTRNEQTFENKNLPNLTETHYSGLANNGRCLQNIESCCRGISGVGDWQNKALNAPQTEFHHPETQPMTSPDVTESKRTKLSRWRGGETVFCLVSRMGEVSGLSRSPEEPLRSCVLPLLTESKPAENIADSPQRNQKDSLEKQMHRENGNTLQEQPTPVQDSNTEAIPDGNKQILQSSGQEKPIPEKFPLWKEPRLQHNSMKERIEQIPEITNTESLVVIDATCVVVKVELVLLPEKEHVQYVCLTEESPVSRTSEETNEQKKNNRTDTNLESPENQTLDEEAEEIPEKLHEHLETAEQITLQEQDNHTLTEHIIEETEESETADLQNESKSFSGTTLVNNGHHLENIMNDQSTAREPEGMFEEFIALADDKLTLETSGIQPEQTTRHLNGETEQENGLTLHKTEEDNEKCGIDTSRDLSENNSTEDNLSDETDDHRELVLDHSKPFFEISVENGIEIQDCVHQDNFPSTEGTNSPQRSTSSDFLPFTSALSTLDGPNETDDQRELVLDCSTSFFQISAENAKEVQDCVHQDDSLSATCTNSLQRSISSDFLSFTFASDTLDGPNKTNDHRELVLDCSTSFFQVSAENATQIQDCVHQADLPSTEGTNSLQRSVSSDFLSFTFASEKLDGTNETDDHRELVLDRSTLLFQISAQNAKEIQDCVPQGYSPFITGTNSPQRSPSSDFLPFTFASDTLDGPHVSDSLFISFTENKPQFLQSSSNREDSGSPTFQTSSTTSYSSTPDTTENLIRSTGMPDEDLLCTPSPSEHKAVIPQVRSLWDAVSRIRKHTAPDSESEEEDTAEFGELTEDADTDCSIRD